MRIPHTPLGLCPTSTNVQRGWVNTVIFKFYIIIIQEKRGEEMKVMNPLSQLKYKEHKVCKSIRNTMHGVCVKQE